MPTTTDARTGKPEYFCDECGQMAHWGNGGKWYCREHKDSSATPAKLIAAVPPPARVSESGAADRRDGQLDLF